MELTSEQVEKFQELYKKRFGVEISYEEAQISGLKLVQLFQLVYKPITRRQYQKFHKSNN